MQTTSGSYFRTRCGRTTPSTRRLRPTDDPLPEEPPMIYELRTYTLIPGKQGEYLKLNSEVGRPTRGQKYGTREGSWTTEYGTLNQFVTIYSSSDIMARARLRAELHKKDDRAQVY